MKNTDSESKQKKRGAQPGNLNAVKHVWRAFFNRGVLKDEYAFLKPRLDDYKRGLIADKGGEANIGNAEMYVANLAERAYGCSLMILIEAGRQGLTRQTKDGWDLHPGFKEHARYMQIELKALQAFGTQRRAAPIESLEQIINGDASE